jgi:hypothetical protein
MKLQTQEEVPMKAMSKSNRNLMQVKQPAPMARSTVAIAITPERTNVSIPNTSEALVGTGLVLLATGLILAALDEEA